MLQKSHLLVLDDEVAFTDIVGQVASDLGYDVRAAHTSLEFKQAFNDFRPATCVLDILMPDDDGIRIIEWLGRQELSPRVIIATGYNPYFLRLANLTANGRGVKIVASLTKPIRLQVLRAAIGRPTATEPSIVAPLPATLDPWIAAEQSGPKLPLQAAEEEAKAHSALAAPEA